MEHEIWKDIPSLPTHEASSLGRVRMKPMKSAKSLVNRTYGGRPTIGVLDKEKGIRRLSFRGKNFKVSRLVCEAFHGPPPPDRPLCLHGDEDSQNNRPGNLSWGTQRANLTAPNFIDYCKTSRRPWVSRTPDEIVRQIRSRKTENQAALAREFGLSASHVNNIIAGRARKGTT